MPLYEYECALHGTFEEVHPMQRSAEPERCPECGEPAPRVLSPTRTTTLSRAVARAHARNEKSQHCPEHRVGHDHRGEGRSAGLGRKGGDASHRHGQRQGLRAHRGARPWVIEHG